MLELFELEKYSRLYSGVMELRFFLSWAPGNCDQTINRGEKNLGKKENNNLQSYL